MECHLQQQTYIDFKSIREPHVNELVFKSKFLGFDEMLSSYTIAKYLLS